MCFFFARHCQRLGLAVLLRNCHCACPQLVIVVLCELWPCVIVVRCVPCGGLWWLVVACGAFKFRSDASRGRRKAFTRLWRGRLVGHRQLLWVTLALTWDSRSLSTRPLWSRDSFSMPWIMYTLHCHLWLASVMPLWRSLVLGICHCFLISKIVSWPTCSTETTWVSNTVLHLECNRLWRSSSKIRPILGRVWVAREEHQMYCLLPSSISWLRRIGHIKLSFTFLPCGFGSFGIWIWNRVGSWKLEYFAITLGTLGTTWESWEFWVLLSILDLNRSCVLSPMLKSWDL